MSESSPVSGAPSTGMESSYRSLEEKVNWLVGVMSERMEREARVSREEVIRNPRLSVVVHLVNQVLEVASVVVVYRILLGTLGRSYFRHRILRVIKDG